MLHRDLVATELRDRRGTYLTMGFAFVVGIVLAIAALTMQAQPAAAQTGPSGVACNASGGSGGLAPGEHNITIAGRAALVYVGSGYRSSQPAILTFYLHGDGAGDQAFLGQVKRDLLDDNGWIYVAPRADTNQWWATGVAYDASGIVGIEANAQLLEDVFEQLFDDYNLCQNVLLGSGVSGGSWFYDGYFLPTRGDRYPAYMNLGCGSSGIDDDWRGFPFYANLLTFNTNPSILARTKLHYSIGTADFLFPPAQRAIPHLQSLGFDVTTDFRDGVGHCAYDIDQTAVNWWTELCATGFVPVTSTNASGSPRPESCNAGQVTFLSCEGLTVTVNLNIGQQPTAGDDVILGTPAADVIDGLGGNDTICGEGGDDNIQGGPGDDTIVGGNGSDKLFGAQGADTIRGGGGNDTIHGNRGNDVLYGDAGDDKIFGYADDDTISGGPGNDRLHGNFGNDTISGDDGADRIFGYGDDDVLSGGAGNDLIGGNFGNDTITGDADNDTLYGSDGTDVVSGGTGNDNVAGNSGNDIVNGDDGNDTLDGGINTDSCNGGAGFDTATRCETTTAVP